MIKIKIALASLFVLIVVVIIGCVSHPAFERQPSSTGAPGEIDDSLAAQIQSDEQLVRNYFRSPATGSVAMQSEVRSLVILAGETQSLASSFDLLLEGLTLRKMTPPPQLINGSSLNCELNESAYFNHRNEVRLTHLQDLFLAQNSANDYTWFLKIFVASYGDTAAQIVAKAQFVRLLQEHHDDYCAGKSCVAFLSYPSQPFEPLNDTQMLAFQKSFRAKIAKYDLNSLLHSPPGECFKDEAGRSPNSVAAYDWKTRSHTGTALPKGQFVVTYDDGPHATYTHLIADEWTASGLPKPTFFWLAKNAVSYPAIVKYVHDSGFEIESHSYDHPDIGNLAKATKLAQLSKVNRTLFAGELKGMLDTQFAAWQTKTLDRQIVTATQDIEKTVSDVIKAPYTVTRFRLPYGSGVGNTSIGQRLALLNVEHYFWAIDSLDWQDHNPASILARIQTQMGLMHRGIILIHDIHKQSYLATQLLLPYLKSTPSITAQSLAGGNL